MTAHVESPFGRIIGVGWKTDRPFGTVLVKAPDTTALFLFTGCGTIPPYAKNVTELGLSESRELVIQITPDQQGFDPSKTHADYLAATYTGQTSGSSWRPADYAPSLQCPGPGVFRYYSSVGTTEWIGFNYYDHHVEIGFDPAGGLRVSLANNTQIGVVKSNPFPGFADFEEVEVTF